MRDNKFLIASALLLCAAVVFAGSLIWYALSSRNTLPVPRAELTQEQKERLAALPQYPRFSPIAGRIESATDGSVTIETGTGSRVVRINSKTQITKIGKNKDAATYAAELKEFEELVRLAPASDSVYTAPTPYETTAATAAELTAGLSIMVIPADGEAQSGDVTAAMIQILPANPQRTATPEPAAL